jgi:hypothetical protein
VAVDHVFARVVDGPYSAIVDVSGLVAHDDLAAVPSGENRFQSLRGVCEGFDVIDDGTNHALVDEVSDAAQFLTVGLDEQEAVGDAQAAGTAADAAAECSDGDLHQSLDSCPIGEVWVGWASDSDDRPAVPDCPE